jgi:predicted nucleic acid-binding protein
MNTTVTFDSSAWIEFFAGTKKGEKVKRYIDEKYHISTASICLLEIKNKYLREGHTYEDRIDYISTMSSIIDITKEIALKGAEIKNTYGLYTVDAVIYAASLSNRSTLITGDHHFEKLKDVEIL